MHIQSHKAFTLIELLIWITIFIIVSVLIFSPYTFYMNKAKVKYTTKELSQIIYEAKNMAKNWSAGLLWNVSVWVYFDANNGINNSYTLYRFPHDIMDTGINPSSWEIIQTFQLQPWIQIDEFDETNKGMIFFRSISWSWIILKWDPLAIVPNTSWENEIEIKYSYKGSTNSTLQNSLTYYQNTQIVDY
jgi:type II secretory pathway pseudopilin PulG